MRMLLAGGGTGGHLFPAVALAEHLLEQERGAKVLFVGTRRGIESRVLPKLGLPLETIEVSGMVGMGLRSKLALVPRLLKSLRQSLAILDRFSPQVVVGVGGYASGPVLLAARLKGYPLLIHEQNAQPGLTNRVLGRIAGRVCLSFAEAARWFPASRVVVTGNPLRRGLESCPAPQEEKPVLLVFGGSRGARAINESVVQALPLLEGLRGRLEIIHQTGEADLDRVREGYRRAGWDPAGVVPFIDDMAAAYGRARLVICRAGATTVAELAACGRPSVLIPFPHAAGDHQTENARALSRRDAAVLLPQSGLTPERLAGLLREMIGDRPRLETMGRNARQLHRGGAAEAILHQCRAIARQE